MSRTLLFETESVLEELRNLRKAADTQRRKLSVYGSYSLTNSFCKGSSKQHYYLKTKGSAERKYLRKDSVRIVNSIKAERYYKKLLEIVDRDIRLLECVEQNYVMPDHDGINRLLPKVYQLDAPPEIMHSSQEAAEWKRRMEAQKAKYEPYRPEDLTHTAQDGTKMRSLSEVLIANYLLSLGITFVYELPMIVNGRRIWPDFTILSPVDNKTVIIIEHQGAMDSESYQAKFIRTVLFYLGTNLIPNKDVFFTFNHLNRDLDLRQIDYILHTAFGYATKHFQDSIAV